MAGDSAGVQSRTAGRTEGREETGRALRFHQPWLESRRESPAAPDPKALVHRKQASLGARRDFRRGCQPGSKELGARGDGRNTQCSVGLATAGRRQEHRSSFAPKRVATEWPHDFVNNAIRAFRVTMKRPWRMPLFVLP